LKQRITIIVAERSSGEAAVLRGDVDRFLTNIRAA